MDNIYNLKKIINKELDEIQNNFQNFEQAEQNGIKRMRNIVMQILNLTDKERLEYFDDQNLHDILLKYKDVAELEKGIENYKKSFYRGPFWEKPKFNEGEIVFFLSGENKNKQGTIMSYNGFKGYLVLLSTKDEHNDNRTVNVQEDELRRSFMIGEKVKIINSQHTEKIGKIVTVTSDTGNFVLVEYENGENDSFWCNDLEPYSEFIKKDTDYQNKQDYKNFEVISKSEQTNCSSRYKIGDKIWICCKRTYYTFNIGEIVAYTPSGNFVINIIKGPSVLNVFSEEEIKKYPKIFDTVKVIDGKYIGKTGIVVNINCLNNKITISVKDNKKIKVFLPDLIVVEPEKIQSFYNVRDSVVITKGKFKGSFARIEKIYYNSVSLLLYQEENKEKITLCIDDIRHMLSEGQNIAFLDNGIKYYGKVVKDFGDHVDIRVIDKSNGVQKGHRQLVRQENIIY